MGQQPRCSIARRRCRGPGLKEGDDIEIHVAGGRAFGVARKPTRDELVRRLRAFRGRLPADFRFDREEANAR